MQEKIIITWAQTRARPLSKNPAQPITLREIASSGNEAADAAGAAILHMHVRDPHTGAMPGELAFYKEAVALIREKNRDVIRNLTAVHGIA